jgi:hypothetical protein
MNEVEKFASSNSQPPKACATPAAALAPQELLASVVGARRPRANAAITLNSAVKIKSFISM